MTASEWEAWSLVCVYTALVIYTLAFVVYALDFASRAAAPVLRRGTSEEADAAVADGGRTVLARVSHRAEIAAGSTYRPGATVRVATALTVLAVVVQAAGVIIRGFAAGRVPFANLYEFTTVGTLLFGVVFLVVLTRRDIRYVGVFVTGLLVALLGISTISFYVPITPLPPALQSPWLVIHIIVASLGWGLLALGCALSILQLLRSRAEHANPGRFTRTMATFPHADVLELLAYRVNIVGFIFWTFTLIAGAIWANDAWGRYWGWDTKEVWTFIIWVIYAGYIHARATRGWRGTRSAWLSIIGFAAVLFNTTIVNVFFKGLHAYSGI